MASELEANNKNLNILFTDFSLKKKVDVAGNLIKFENSDALSQAFKIWLISKKNEKIRTQMGGYLYPFLAKPMNNESANQIIINILKGIEKEFTPKLTIQDFQVIPDYINKRWVITITAYSSELNIGINDYTIVNSKGTGV
jgi:hypothetical protein